jgi:hypothetical protein
MDELPFGLSADQVTAIGLTLVGIGIFSLLLYFGEDVTVNSAMFVVLLVFCGGSMIGYSSAMSNQNRW